MDNDDTPVVVQVVWHSYCQTVVIVFYNDSDGIQVRISFRPVVLAVRVQALVAKVSPPKNDLQTIYGNKRKSSFFILKFLSAQLSPISRRVWNIFFSDICAK